MLTCKSPRKVMLVALELAKTSLPTYSNEFSRHDFTLPQLFACLVLREHQKKSYRGVEALLKDSPQWCQAIGLDGGRPPPDHSTLSRAFSFGVQAVQHESHARPPGPVGRRLRPGA